MSAYRQGSSQSPASPTWLRGYTGWTPVLGIVEDGARRVQRVVDWTGGTGVKPSSGQYVGSAGYVDTAAEAADVRGAGGADGSPDTGAQIATKLAGLTSEQLAPVVEAMAIESGGSGASVKFTRTQTAHGLVAARVVQSGASGFEYAQADSAANVQRIMGVIESVATDDMVVVSSGAIDVTGWGLTANTTYFLSAASAGVLTNTPPTGETEYYVEVLRVDADGNAYVTLGEPVALAKIPATDLALSVVSQAEAEAGAATDARLWTAERVAQAIAALAAGGGTAEFTTGMAMLWATADLANKPSGWIEAGDYGTAAQPSIGDWSVIVKSGGTVADPEFSVAAGEVEDDSTVEITCTTPGHAIRYTTDGSTPTRTTGTVYSGAITITDDVTIKAIAYLDGFVDSQVVSGAYTVATTETFSDDFERANESPISTNGWSSGPGAWGDMELSAGTVIGTASTGSQGAVLTTPVFDSNQEASITLASAGTNDGLLLRVQSIADGSCYSARRVNASEWQIAKITDTGSIGSSAIGANIAMATTSGDVVTFRATGTGPVSLELLLNGSSEGSHDDVSSVLTGGQPGIRGTTSTAIGSFSARSV